MDNGALERINRAIEDPSTPKWGIAMLLCMRDDHAQLTRHLSWHVAFTATLCKVGLPAAGAIVAAVIYAFLRWLPAALP